MDTPKDARLVSKHYNAEAGNPTSRLIIKFSGLTQARRLFSIRLYYLISYDLKNPAASVSEKKADGRERARMRDREREIHAIRGTHGSFRKVQSRWTNRAFDDSLIPFLCLDSS